MAGREVFTGAAAPSSIVRSKHGQDGRRTVFRSCLIRRVRRQNRANGITLVESDLVQSEDPDQRRTSGMEPWRSTGDRRVSGRAVRALSHKTTFERDNGR